MEQLKSSVEGLLTSDTVGAWKQTSEDIWEAVVQFCQDHPYVLAGTGAVIFLYWYLKNNHGFFKNTGIPGPKPGLLGALSEYRKGFMKHDRELMTKYGKVVGIFHARSPVYMVSDVDMIRQIMVKEFPSFINRVADTFPRDPVFGDSLVATFDDHWKFLRHTLSPTFTSGKMREMSPLIDKCTESLIRNLWTMSEEGTKTLKMKDVFGMFTLDVIASTAFGIELDCQSDPDNAFIKYAKKVMTQGMKAWTVMLTVMIFPFSVRLIEKLGFTTMDTEARDFFVRTVNEAIEQRRKHNVSRTDFLQLMLNSHKLEMDKEEEDPDTHLEFDEEKKRGMTNNEVVANACLFLLAGYETTSLALTYMAYNLAANPEWQDKLIQEIDDKLQGKPADHDSVLKLQLLDNAFLETLRMYPAAPRISRAAKRDIQIKDVSFKKDAEIHIPVAAIHFDPEYWPDPDSFNPDRFLPENKPADFNYVYLPFGAGPRNCIGMRLAHMEVKMAMVAVLQKYRFKTAPETKIPPDVDVQMKPKDGMILMIEKR